MATSNPVERGPTPPFPDQSRPNPGLESEMSPTPDYGEDSYGGSGKLHGKAALITGGDSGIGRAVALAFAREGADMLIAYLNEDTDAQETVRIVEKKDASASRSAEIFRKRITASNSSNVPSPSSASSISWSTTPGSR